MRKINFLFFNVNESKSKDSDERINNNKLLISNLLAPITDASPPIQVLRIDGHRSKKPRPPKTIFSCNEEGKRVLRNKNKSPNTNF